MHTETWCVVVSSSLGCDLRGGPVGVWFSCPELLVGCTYPSFFFRVGHFPSSRLLSELFVFDVVSPADHLFVCLLSVCFFSYRGRYFLSLSLLCVTLSACF